MVVTGSVGKLFVTLSHTQFVTKFMGLSLLSSLHIDTFSKTKFIRYSLFDTFFKTEYIWYSVFGRILLFVTTLHWSEMIIVQEKLTKIREKQATMPGWRQGSGHQGSLDRAQPRTRSQQGTR